MNQQRRPRWWLTRRQWVSVVALLAAGFLLIVVLGYILGWGWTGFTEPQPRRLWDWLDLLIIPIVLAIGGYLFNRSENRVTQATAERRSQDEALQAYLDKIGELLLDKKLRAPRAGKEARTLARARTVTALKRLDAEHNRSILHFLRDSNLIGENNFINFSGADLEGADLTRAYLPEAPLIDTNLINANLFGAILDRADLTRAYLIDANLTSASLGGANLSEVYLNSAKLRGANLTGVHLVHANLNGADLSGANLNGADLEGANLEGANLSGVHVRGANLSGATLDDASLNGADLIGARVTDEQLAAAESLEGATMPDWQRYEDWLKDKGGRLGEG